MFFALICKDKENSVELRVQTRPTHLDYIKETGDKIKIAGPFLDENEKPSGSLIIVDVQDEAEANEIAANDPYAKAGLFETVQIKRWNWVINPPKEEA